MIEKLPIEWFWYVLLAFIGFIMWLLGITRPLWRLGRGFFSRKIAVFADSDNYSSLKKLLLDTKLFRDKNIIQISKADALSASGYSMILLHWKSFEDVIASVLGAKREGAVMIVYAPYDEGKISNEAMGEIAKHKNVAVANFRGRVLTDVITGLMITEYKYEKR